MICFERATWFFGIKNIYTKQQTYLMSGNSMKQAEADQRSLYLPHNMGFNTQHKIKFLNSSLNCKQFWL